MDLREFVRFHLIKVLLALVVLQIIIFAIIQNYNHRPVAFRDLATVVEGKVVKITPLTNDIDKDLNDQLSLSHISKAEHGIIQHIGNLVSYHSKFGFSGVDSFSYTISDGRKESKAAWVVVNVLKNLPPVAKRDSFSVLAGTGSIIEVMDNDTDPEKDSLFVNEFTKPIYGQLKITGNKLIYISNNPSSNVDSFSYKVSDGRHTSESATVIIKSNAKNDLNYPWLSADIGDVSRKGELLKQNQSFVIKASGSDIWGDADGFRYVYQYVKGDCEMYTKVESLEGKNDWAKAGLMIRESLTRGSKMAIVCATTLNGIATHFRLETNQPADNIESHYSNKVPFWIKLERKGNRFKYFDSADGILWNSLGSNDIAMPENVYIGFAVTSHDNNLFCKAVFNNYKSNFKQAKL